MEKEVKKFRILKDWNIKFEKNSIYKGQVNYNPEIKVAVIYDWPNKNRPKDYYLHEVLHIAFRVAENSREKQELFIQDLCKLISK